MKTMNSMNEQYLKFGRIAVIINMIGIVFSGLVFPVLSMIFTPQLPWRDAAMFVESFHPLQTATFFCGYFLVIGSLLTFIALYKTATEDKKIWALSGLVINMVFTSVVFLNYIIQTTYIPYLAYNNPPETATILPVFTMTNPGSFAWALEMYGWGGIGLSFIFMAFIFETNKLERTLKFLFLTNGVCSVASALMTSINMNWLFSPAGLTALVVWNLLVFVIDFFLLNYFKNLKFSN
ncbi:MAG TPA: hypothetical protein DER09_01730 [Prolixibacteraceae bacterium]|nr:hypothetical protein [Prolixibacteraceae bacterium]